MINLARPAFQFNFNVKINYMEAGKIQSVIFY